jgi:hypothetical protein
MTIKMPQIETPIFITNLISDSKKVEFRPFLAKEHKVLLTLQEAEIEEISHTVSNLVDVCTFNKLDVGNLPHFDLTWLFLKIRSKSIGEEIKIVVNCKCGNKVKSSYSLEELKVIRDEKHDKKIILDGTYGVTMKYPNIEQALEIINKNDLTTEFISDHIENIFTKDECWYAKDDKEIINNFVDSFTLKHMEKITEFYRSSPQLVQEVQADCDKCGNHIDAKISGLYNFFV